MPPKKTIEQEAKEFAQSKKVSAGIKPMTARRYFTGQAMMALLVLSQGKRTMSEIRREALEWADYMLEDDD